MKTNKLKEQLRLKMLGQLSDEKTQLDVDNAYGVCKEFCISFNLFCRKFYSTKQFDGWDLGDDIWRNYDTDKEFTTEELFNKFTESYGTDTAS